MFYPYFAVCSVLDVARFALVGIYNKDSVCVPITATTAARIPREDVVKVVLWGLCICSHACHKSHGIIQAGNGFARVCRSAEVYTVAGNNAFCRPDDFLRLLRCGVCPFCGGRCAGCSSIGGTCLAVCILCRSVRRSCGGIGGGCFIACVLRCGICRIRRSVCRCRLIVRILCGGVGSSCRRVSGRRFFVGIGGCRVCGCGCLFCRRNVGSDFRLHFSRLFQRFRCRFQCCLRNAA